MYKLKYFFRIISILIFSQGLHFNSNAQNSDDYVIINDIIVAGNKITKEQVITREILFQSGDTLQKTTLNQIIKKSEESLLNTGLFNYATINIIPQYNSHVNIFILLEERWYLWPYPILEHADRNLSSFLKERDWNRINYGLMLVKNNFRGRNETLSLKLRLGYKEQYQVKYLVPYLFRSKKHGLATEFSYFRQKKYLLTQETTN